MKSNFTKSFFLYVLVLGIAALFPAKEMLAQTCNCKEYIYLNEPNIGTVLKFEVGNPVPLTEVIGVNGGPHWYPGAGASVMPFPHGLATDLNGRLYVGADANAGNPVRQFSCDGAIAPISPATINDPTYFLFNMFSIGNTIYKNGDHSIRAYNSCTGAFVGSKCLNGPSDLYWGLSFNKTTQTGYASARFGGGVWKFTKAQLEDFSTCLNVFIPRGPNPTVNPGENWLPSTDIVTGVVGDDAGNIYVVMFPSGVVPGVTSILKYNAAGQFVAKTAPNIAFGLPIGIVWSETNNRLYVSNYTDNPAVDCISAIDAASMLYIGTAAANPNVPSGTLGKAIAIIKECCPANANTTINKSICDVSVGDKFYLNEITNTSCGTGVVCGNVWTSSPSNTGFIFDPCDNSVVITDVGACGTFMAAGSSSQCGVFNTTLNLCTRGSLSNPSPPQTLCEGSTGANVTVQTDNNDLGSIRFVRFNSDQTANNATPTAAEVAAIYTGGTTLATVNPSGVASPYTATLIPSAAGWSGLAPGTYYVYGIFSPDPGAGCRPVQEIIVTIIDKPEVTVQNGLVCTGNSINLNTLVTSNNPAGNLSFHASQSDADNNIAPLPNNYVTPVSSPSTYYLRSSNTTVSTCFATASFQVTLAPLPALAVTNGQTCQGSSIDLGTLVANTGGGTITYYATKSNAESGSNPLPGSSVTPAAATNYYIRSTDANGCYTVKEVTVSFRAGNCGTIQTSGPN
jgi:hypothetical protein